MEEHGRLKLVADVALFSGDRVLLVKYNDTRRYDQQAGWFLPDDYMPRLEPPEDAALRILKDQVGLDTVRVDLRFIESFEGNRAWHLVFHFAGTLPDGSSPAAGTNTAAMEWFSADHLPDRANVAHQGWARGVLASLAKPPEESAHI